MSSEPIDPAALSFWLETAGEPIVPRASLDGDAHVDVAIVGGGFSGLWTAYHLLRRAPGLSVLVVERGVCGQGASGRNGGWCSPRFPVDPAPLVRRVGLARARATMRALQDAVARIGATCEEEGIDAHYRHTGLLNIARSARQMDLLVEAAENQRALGLDEDMRLLSAGEAADRVRVTDLHGGLWSSAGAAVHPGRLVRGLARAVERHGGRIVEGTAVSALRGGADAALVTARGTVRARRGVIAAAEAYLPKLPGYGRAVAPMSSMIVLTEPLDAATWEQIGWARGESLCSPVNIKNYLTRTADGRILYGSRGAPYVFGSNTPEAAVRDERVFAWMRETVRRWWPALEAVRFTHAWGGYLGVPRDWMPTVAFDAEQKLGTLHGYTGRGVATSELAGRLLAARILGLSDGLEDLPFHAARARAWEPEPLRWAGIRYVDNAYLRMDRADALGRSRPFDAALAKTLGGQG